MRERGLVDDGVHIVTTIHDCQIVDAFPVEKHDLPVDHILTPTRHYETNTKMPKPEGIYWDFISVGTLRAIPVLSELKATISRNRTQA